MLFKQKQFYWVDGYVDGKRIKVSTGFKDKQRAQEFYLNLVKKTMIKNRLSMTLPFTSKMKN
jgi:hypothetical protein